MYVIHYQVYYKHMHAALRLFWGGALPKLAK